MGLGADFLCVAMRCDAMRASHTGRPGRGAEHAEHTGALAVGISPPARLHRLHSPHFHRWPRIILHFSGRALIGSVIHGKVSPRDDCAQCVVCAWPANERAASQPADQSARPVGRVSPCVHQDRLVCELCCFGSDPICNTFIFASNAGAGCVPRRSSPAT